MLVIKKASELSAKANDEWLIENVLPARSLCLLGAAPKLGKTMVALELATSLCTGMPAFGKHLVPRKGKVLYYAGEDAESGFKKRIDGFAKHKTDQPEGLELYTITEQQLLIDTEEGRKVLSQTIESIKPDLVVLDNLSRIHHSNENNATTVGLIFEFLQELKLKYGCTILLVCHMGKDGSIRGSSQIDSYYESAIFLRAKEGIKYMDFKFRNYEERLGIPFHVDSSDGLRFVVGDNQTQPTTESAKVVALPSKPSSLKGYTIQDLVEAGIMVRTESGAYRHVS